MGAHGDKDHQLQGLPLKGSFYIISNELIIMDSYREGYNTGDTESCDQCVY